jgi:hypothetical protein
MSPKDILIHFLLWLVAPLVVIYLYGNSFYPFIVLGGFVLLGIEYQAFGSWGKAPFAVIGLSIASAIGYFVMGYHII